MIPALSTPAPTCISRLCCRVAVLLYVEIVPQWRVCISCSAFRSISRLLYYFTDRCRLHPRPAATAPPPMVVEGVRGRARTLARSCNHLQYHCQCTFTLASAEWTLRLGDFDPEIPDGPFDSERRRSFRYSNYSMDDIWRASRQRPTHREIAPLLFRFVVVAFLYPTGISVATKNVSQFSSFKNGCCYDQKQAAWYSKKNKAQIVISFIWKDIAL